MNTPSNLFVTLRKPITARNMLLALGAVILALVLLPRSAEATHDPSTPVEHVYSVTFSSTGQSQYGPGAFPDVSGLNTSFELFDVGWNESAGT